jgi:hypothetical protein
MTTTINIKFTLEQAMKAQRRVEVYLYSFFRLGVRCWGGWWTPRPYISIPGKETRYQFYRTIGGPQDRSGWMRETSPLPGFDPRTFQPVTSRYAAYTTPAIPSLNLNKLKKKKIWPYRNILVLRIHFFVKALWQNLFSFDFWSNAKKIRLTFC